QQRVLTRTGIECTLACQRLHLARNALGVVARLRPEHGATANEVRSPDRTLTGTTGSLLLPRLPATAGHLPTSLRGCIALTLVGKECLDRLVHHRHVDRAIELLGRKCHCL